MISKRRLEKRITTQFRKQASAGMFEYVFWTIVGLVVLAVILITVLLVRNVRPDWKEAEAAATAYARNVTEATGAVTCAHADTDGDGYCSCSVFLKKGQPLALECGCESFCIIQCVEGCRQAMPKIRNQNYNYGAR